MYQIQDERPGAMAAVVGLNAQDLDALCADISQKHYVTVTNWNTYTQFVVSGVEEGVLALMKAAGAYQNVRVIRLMVRGAFHSLLMTPVQSALSPIMHNLTWQKPRVPLIANASGAMLISHEAIHQELLAQITNPVLWVRCVETMKEAGCDTFVELGASQVLTRLVRSIAPECKTFSADTLEKVAAVATALSSAVHA